MPLLSRLPRRSSSVRNRAPAHRPQTAPARGHLPAGVEARVRLSHELLAALLEVESRSHATLDDLEWSDAVADRMLRRRAAQASKGT